MNIYSVISNVGSIFCLTLGVFALRQNSRQFINRLFFLLSITLAGFIFWANLGYDADTKDHLLVIYYISVFFFGPFFAVNFHFNLVFTRHKLKIWQCVLLYIPALIVILTTFLDHSLFSDFIFENGKWNFVPAYRHFGFYFYLVYTASYTIGSMIIIDAYRRKTGLNKEKQRALIINFAYIFSLLSGFLYAFTLPYFGIYQLSRLGPISYCVYFFAIYYSVFRYKFLELVPSVIMDDIIGHLSDMVILLKPDLTISKTNSRYDELLGIKRSLNTGKAINEIIIDDGIIFNNFNELVKGELQSFNSKMIFKAEPENLITDSYVSRIIDRFNDFVAVLTVAKENQGILQFKKQYGITGRQMDIIQMTVDGLSNDEICEKLSLARRTVETHLSNIYEKLSVKNRIELARLADEYNILTKNRN